MRRLSRSANVLIPAVFVLAALLMAACVAPAPPATPASAPGLPGALVDTRWAVALLGGTAPAAFDTAASLTLQFGGRDTVIGNGGCTAFRGPATGGNTRLGLGPLTAGTASCGEAIDRQERTYLELLQATAGYVVVDDELLLLDATGKELVRLSKVE